MSFVSFYQVRSLERLFKTDFWVYYFAYEKKSTVAILVINLMSCEECRSSLTNKFSVSHPVSNSSFVAHTNKFFHNQGRTAFACDQGVKRGKRSDIR